MHFPPPDNNSYGLNQEQGLPDALDFKKPSITFQPRSLSYLNKINIESNLTSENINFSAAVIEGKPKEINVSRNFFSNNIDVKEKKFNLKDKVLLDKDVNKLSVNVNVPKESKKNISNAKSISLEPLDIKKPKPAELDQIFKAMETGEDVFVVRKSKGKLIIGMDDKKSKDHVGYVTPLGFIFHKSHHENIKNNNLTFEYHKDLSEEHKEQINENMKTVFVLDDEQFSKLKSIRDNRIKNENKVDKKSDVKSSTINPMNKARENKLSFDININNVAKKIAILLTGSSFFEVSFGKLIKAKAERHKLEAEEKNKEVVHEAITKHEKSIDDRMERTSQDTKSRLVK